MASIHTDAMAVLARVRSDQHGFLAEDDVTALAQDDRTRLTQCLVRCGSCRFVAGAQDVAHIIGIIEGQGADYVRDVSLQAGGRA